MRSSLRRGQGWGQAAETAVRAFLFPTSMLLPSAPSPEPSYPEIVSSRSPTQLFLLGVRLPHTHSVLPCTSRFRFLPTHSPTESQTEPPHPFLVPNGQAQRNKPSSLGMCSVEGDKEGLQRFNKISYFFCQAGTWDNSLL